VAARVLQVVVFPYRGCSFSAHLPCRTHLGWWPRQHALALTFPKRLQKISAIRTLGGDIAGLLFRRCWHIQLKSLQAFFGRSLTESALGNTTTPS
jgi:hypothetical protein